MLRVIFSIVGLLLILGIVILNVGNTTDFNLFGMTFEGISVVAVSLISFVVGILYSFTYYVHGKIRRLGSEKLKKKQEALIDREKALKEKEKSGPGNAP